MHLLNCIRERHRLPCDFGMEQLDHTPVQRDGTLALILGQSERGQDRPSANDLVGRRRKNAVAGVDLRWVDQRLAVEPDSAPLNTDRLEALSVGDFVRRTSMLRYSCEALERSAKKIATLAIAEGLDAHADSALIRLSNYGRESR